MTTAAASMEQGFAAALLDPRAPCPAGLRAWNGSDPGRRFAVHRNNVMASLVEALADTFPVVQALVGAEFFGAMAAVFVREAPPRSPLLFRYGAAFPAFLARFAPAAQLPCLPDVARLEFARVEAFHAADAAPLPVLALPQVLAHGERIGELRLVPHPSLRLVRSSHPVVSLWGAHQGQGTLEGLDLARAECALVVRPRLDVLVVGCDDATLRFAEAAQRGCPLAECAAAAGAGELPAVLATLFAHGALARIDPPAGGGS